jgi:hypothetical protein
MRHYEYLSEDELFEINMSPSNLQKLAKDIPQAKFGLEFEMIVPNTNADDGDAEYENDYDYDERARSFRGIYDFFTGGDGNNSRRDVQGMIDALQEHYNDWANEKRWEDWNNNGYDFFVEYAEDLFDAEDAEEDARDEIATEYPDLDPDSEEFTEKVAALVEDRKDTWLREEWENQGRIYDDARESWEDGADWPDEDDWLEQEGYRYMSDLESFGHDHDVYWPHQTASSSGDTDMEEVAESIGAALGVEVKVGGYHNISRANQESEGFWILETDGSLQGDSSDDAGLELVSPPLTLDRMKEAVKRVAEWAESYGAYTGKSNKTGLHMNVSVPGYSQNKLDFVKLALLLGDNHILKEFDRVNYTYAKSSFDLLSGKLKGNPDLAKKAMATMKGHFDMAASKALHSGSTDKYTSINVKDNRVEFRGPGGDYLKMFETNPNKLFAPMMRFAVALDAAIDPTKYRDEYQKKLYKFLSKSVPSKDLLELFTDYAAGKGFAQSAYKSFLKHRKSERELEKALTSPGGGIRVAGRKSNPDGNWVLFRQHRRDNDYVQPFDVEVLFRFNAVTQADATIVQDQYVREHNPEFQVLVGSDPDKKYGQPGDFKKPESKDDGAKANWGVYKKSDDRHMKYNGNYIRFENATKDEAEAQLRLLFQTAHTTAQIQDYEVRKLSKYELYRKSNGLPVRSIVNGVEGDIITFDAGSPAEAESKIQRYVDDFNLSGQVADYDVRSVLTPPAHTTRSSGEMELYNVRRLSTDTIVSAFRVPNHAHAVQKFHDFIARAGGSPEQYRLERADANGESHRETPRAADGSAQATAANGVPMWVIYRVSDGEVVHRFADHASSHARTALSWLRDHDYENPSTTFRVRAMSQNEQQSSAVPGSTDDRQQQRAQATDVPPATQAQGGFTGYWKIIDSNTGEELHRFNGIGNSQADANRVATQWLRDHGPEDANMTEISVLPVMGNQ